MHACSVSFPAASLTNASGCFFTFCNELLQDMFRWIGSIEEVHVHMLDALAGELLRVVVALVQAHHEGDISALEVGNIVLRTQGVVAARTALALCMWAGKA